MSIITIISAIGKLLWPFFKETVLQNGTFGDFVRKNKSMCFWLAVMVTMQVIVLYFYDATTRARQSEAAAIGELQRSKEQLALMKQRLTLIEADQELKASQIRDMQAEMTALEAVNADSSEVIDRYRGWMLRCGVDPDYAGPTFPQCRVSTAPPRTVKPRPRTKPKSPPVDPAVLLPPVEPAPPVKKPGFWRRVREIFGGSKKDDEGQ